MTTELACLVLSALWGGVLVQIEALGKIRAGGLAWATSNRDAQPARPAWNLRAGRALANHQENFPLFATAIVAVLLAGKTDTVTRYAAIAFVALRALHGLTYIAGIQGLRTVLWIASLLAALAVMSQLVF